MTNESETSTGGGGKAFVRAVPWKTPTEDKVKGALGEIPAYVRRTKTLEDAHEAVYREARTVRAGLLVFVSLRLRRVVDVGAAAEVPGEIRDEVESLEVFRRLSPRPRSVARPRDRNRAMSSLRTSIRRFNDNWERWVREEAPLTRVNRLIAGYNRHYRLERQCALRYVPLSAITFTPRDPVTPEDLLRRHPLLPLP